MRVLFESLGILVNLGLGLFCVALATLGWIDGGDLAVPLVPVAPESAVTALAIAGVYAILASGLAIRSGRSTRLPLLIWSAVLLGVLLAAIFRGAYRFDGMDAFIQHGMLVVGAAILLGASCARFRSVSSRTMSSQRISRRSGRLR